MTEGEDWSLRNHSNYEEWPHSQLLYSGKKTMTGNEAAACCLCGGHFVCQQAFFAKRHCALHCVELASNR